MKLKQRQSIQWQYRGHTGSSHDECAILSHLHIAAAKLPIQVPTVVLEHLPTLQAQTQIPDAISPAIERALRIELDLPQDVAPPFEPTWLPNGMPKIMATPDSGLNVSVTHEGGYAICTVGADAQFSNLSTVRRLNRKDWLSLLDSSRDDLLAELLLDDTSVDQAGSRIWSVLQATQQLQAASSEISNLAIKHRAGDAVIFQVSLASFRFSALTLPIQFSDGVERILTIGVEYNDEVDSVKHTVQNEKKAA